MFLDIPLGRESDALFEDKVRNCKKCKTNGLLAIDTCVQQTKKVTSVFLGYVFMALFRKYVLLFGCYYFKDVSI